MLFCAACTAGTIRVNSAKHLCPLSPVFPSWDARLPHRRGVRRDHQGTQRARGHLHRHGERDVPAGVQHAYQARPARAVLPHTNHRRDSGKFGTPHPTRTRTRTCTRADAHAPKKNSKAVCWWFLCIVLRSTRSRQHGTILSLDWRSYGSETSIRCRLHRCRCHQRWGQKVKRMGTTGSSAVGAGGITRLRKERSCACSEVVFVLTASFSKGVDRQDLLWGQSAVPKRECYKNQTQCMCSDQC